MVTSQHLLAKIEFLRNKMTEVAIHNGLTSCESIRISQELDKLLNMYEECKFYEGKDNRD